MADRKMRIREVERLPLGRADEATAVLCESFYDYPVFPYVIGDVGDAYGKRIETLIGYFVAVRFYRGEPVLAVSDSGRAVAAAIVTPPFPTESPPQMIEHREAVWKELGSDARARYEGMGESWQKFSIEEPHYHLNMIGVDGGQAGGGLGRVLLNAVHQMSRDDPDSVGVSLTTETESNVGLYLHVGYELLGHVPGDPAPDTWVFVKRDA